MRIGPYEDHIYCRAIKLLGDIAAQACTFIHGSLLANLLTNFLDTTNMGC